MEAPSYDVALSFDNADRPFAAALANSLRSKGLRVFYDSMEPGALWGHDLSEHLKNLYSASRVCVLLLSSAYVTNKWVMFEARIAMARATHDASIEVLPLRLDNSELPPALKTIAALDARRQDPDDVAGLIKKRVDMTKAGTAHSRLTPSHKPDYHVISRTGGWVVKAANAHRVSRVMKTKSDAVEHARDLARRHSADQVIVHGEDGSVERRFSTQLN